MILDTLTQAARYHGIHSGIDAALDWLAGEGPDNLARLEMGRHDNLTAHAGTPGTPGIFGIMQGYDTRSPDTVVWEAHRAYIDVQVMISGRERVGWRSLTGTVAEKSAYEAKRDAAFYDLPDDGTGFLFEAGQFAIFWPSDIHAPNLRVQRDAAAGSPVTKLVIKVPV